MYILNRIDKHSGNVTTEVFNDVTDLIEKYVGHKALIDKYTKQVLVKLEDRDLLIPILLDWQIREWIAGKRDLKSIWNNFENFHDPNGYNHIRAQEYYSKLYLLYPEKALEVKAYSDSLYKEAIDKQRKAEEAKRARAIKTAATKKAKLLAQLKEVEELEKLAPKD